MSLAINPETKVGALLDAYPGIEDQLISWVPAFSKLKNPILRKTVAKVATLQQAAMVGGVSVRDLVRRLREATGQDATSDESPISESSSAAGAGTHGDGAVPEWVTNGTLRHSMDADALLASGEHPLASVQHAIATLGPNETIQIRSSFRPAPLIDMMREKGHRIYWREISADHHETWLARQQAGT